MQYDGWIKQIKDIDYSIKALNISGMPKNSKVSKPTEELAIKKTELIQKCEIIKQAAMEAAPEIYEEILKNVTQNIPFKYLDVPYSRRQFYRKKNDFLCILSQKQDNIS